MPRRAEQSHTHLEIDIGNRAAIDDVFQAFRPDAVLHLAAESHVDRSIDGAAPFIEPNIGGTCRILEATLGGRDVRYAIDAEKIKAELGWRPRRDFDAGLRQTVRWDLDNRDWWERVMNGAYRGERLGFVG